MNWLWFTSTAALVIVSVLGLERAIRALNPPQQTISAIRIMYPLWTLLVLDNVVEVSWLIGFYGLAIGVVAMRKAQRVLKELREDDQQKTDESDRHV